MRAGIGRSATRAIVASGIAACVASMLASPAAAEIESASDRVDDALSHAGVRLDETRNVASTGSVVDLSSERPSARITSDGVSVDLTLTSSGRQQAESSGNGRTFADVARDTDALVRVVDGGAQILSVMRTRAAASSQRYQIQLPAGTRLKAVGAAFDLVQANGRIVGHVAAPWAKDASGRSLPTSYRLVDTVLVQETDTSDAKYPVVADPKITIGRGIYLNMWGHEVRTAAIAIIALGGVSFVVACTAIGAIPHAFLKTLAALICGAASVNLTKVWQAIVDTYYWSGWVNGACYQQRILPMNSGRMVQVSSSNCS